MNHSASTAKKLKHVATKILAKLIVSATIAFPLSTGALLSVSASAKADFRICNDTNSLVGAALGYREEGEWVSEGWFQVPGDSCTSLIEGDLNSRFYYVYAEDADRGGQWRGDIFLCTNDREFRIVGVKDCFKRGHVRTGFFEIDTSNRSSWMVRLTESSQNGQAQ